MSTSTAIEFNTYKYTQQLFENTIVNLNNDIASIVVVFKLGKKNPLDSKYGNQ